VVGSRGLSPIAFAHVTMDELLGVERGAESPNAET